MIQSLMAAMVQILRTFALVASLVVPVAGGAQAQPASVNDTARLLAGMQPSPDSPLLALTKEQAWQQYAKRFDAIFANIESRQLTRIRAWSRAKLTSPSPVLFYMFSGPDFLYANAFFPNASTYVMSGLEPIGSVPDLTKLSRDSLAHGLSNIEESLNSILRYSFFQTIEMRRTLVAGRVTGTLPILYVFLARSGKTIRDVSLVGIGEDGTARVDDGADREAATVETARAASRSSSWETMVGRRRFTISASMSTTTASGPVVSLVFANASALATHSSRARHI